MSNQYICLWFDHEAEEAANFYCSIFKNSKLGSVARYGPAAAKVSGCQEGSVMTVNFELDGMRYMALNGGPVFKHTPAMSICVNCDTQDEIDYYWEKLAQGGGVVECGWLTDKYGISWQIVPSIMDKMMEDKDEAKKDAVMGALIKMKKLEIAPLEKAFAAAGK